MAVNPSNWEEDLRKRGAAARAKLLYRADDQPQQRQPLAYIPDDATASQPSGRLQYIPDRQETKTPQTIPVPASNGVSKPRALTPGEFLTQTNKALQNGGWNLPAVAAANPSTKPTAEELKIAQQIAKNDADRAKTGAPKWLQNAAGEIDRFVMNNPVGKGLKRFSQASAEVFGITPESVGEIQASTGNKALDKALDVAGGLAGYATNPAQIESNLIGGTYNAARSALNTRVGQQIEQGLQNAASRITNRVAPGLSQRVTDRLITGALEGGAANALQNAAIGAMAGQTSGQDVARNALIGGLLGGAADAGLGALGAALRRTPESAPVPETPTLALPAPRERGNLNTVQTPDVIPVPETGPRGLPEPSPALVTATRNANAARAEIAAIDDQLRALESQYQQAINEQYKFLRESMAARGGVSQGTLIRNEAGDVVGRTGRTSNNPEWYQQFYREYGRAPTNRDLYELAKRHIDEGFVDNGVQVPSWRDQNNYDETVAALQKVRQQLGTYAQDRTGVAAAPQSFPARAPGVKPIPKEPEAARNLSPFKQEPPATAPERPNGEFTPSKPASGPVPLRFTPFGKREKFTDPTDTRTYIVSKTDREPINFAGAVDEFYRKTADNLHDLNKFDKYVEKQTGKPLPAEDRTHLLALNSRGNDVIAKHILTERLVDSQGNQIGESLKNIAQEIPKGAYNNFKDYLIARHAETRVARGEKVYDPRTGMNDVGNIARKIEKYEATYPQFKELAQRIYDWNDKLGQAWLVDTGIIPQEMWDAWKRENPYWIPNQRYFSKLEKTGKARGAKRGFASQSNPVKKYSPGGSERPIIDPIESMIEYVDRYVKTAKRNEVMQAIVRNLEKDPEGLEGFAEIVPKEDYANYSSIKELNDAIQKDGIDGLLDKLDQELDIKYNKDRYQRTGNMDNVVTALINGEKVPVKINDINLLNALTNLSPQAQNLVIEAARKATNAMKLLTTGINPVFSLTRNIFRDIPQAYIFSKTTNNPFRFAWDLLDGIVSTFGNKELYKRYKAVGGGHSSSVAADRNLLAQSKREILPQQRQGLGLLKRAYGAAENLANVIESAPRLAEFKRITKAGGNTYESRIKGLYEANDLTTNFKRKGQITKDADAFLPYLNAAVQGLDKFVRSFKDNPVAVTAKSFLAITVPTVGLFALNYNNENYKKLSNYVKDNFFLIPLTNGQFIKIPKPRELGVPFGSMIERVMRAWLQKDPESFRDFADTVSNAFAPPGIPAKELASGNFMDAAIAPVRDTILGPLVDVASNKTFTGAPIVPAYLSDKSPRYQYDANTSEVSKKIGDILNVSPKQLDHLIRSYTGVIGQIGLPASSQGSTVGQTLIKQVTADPVFSTDATSYFYDLKDKLDRQYNDMKFTGKPPKGYSDSLRKYINKVANQISDITSAIRAVDDMKLTSKQKADKKRELTELRNNLARQAYQTALNVQK